MPTLRGTVVAVGAGRLHLAVVCLVASLARGAMAGVSHAHDAPPRCPRIASCALRSRGAACVFAFFASHAGFVRSPANGRGRGVPEVVAICTWLTRGLAT